MSWTKGATTERGDHGRPVVHDGRIVWLWHHDVRGQAFDPTRDVWTPLATVPFGERVGAVVASAGGTLVAWGGTRAGSRVNSSNAVSGGKRLDGDRWQPMATKLQPSARAYAVHVWTGHELVVWGGSKGAPIANGAAYDPAADSWRKLATKGAAAGRGEHVWTGTEVWIWGGQTRTGGFAYDVTEDRWRSLANVPGRDGDALHARDIVRMADSALYVRREDATGSDDDRCAVWRYEPRADMWEPCAPPPEVRGSEPRIADCDGRIVLALANQLFEYLPLRDAWAALPALPKDSWPNHFVWTNERLYAFLPSGEVHRLALPETVEPVAVAANPLAPAITMRKRPECGRGLAVTALAIGSAGVLVGHADGSVHRGDKVVREADGKRVLGLVAHDGAWACLVGDKLEVESGKPVALPFEGQLLAHDGDRLAVSGDGAIATLAWVKRKWTVVKTAKASGTTSALSLRGEVLARAVLGPPRARGSRKAVRDTVEVLDAATLKTRATFAPTFERGTTSVVAMEDGALVAGVGGYEAVRYAVGKKKPDANIHTDTAWSSPIVADGGWVLVRLAGRGGELYDGDRRDLVLEPFDYDESVNALHPLPAFLGRDDGAKLVESTRIAGAVSAIALGNGGATVALGLSAGATLVVDRDSLAIQLVPARGRAQTWQPGCSEVAGRARWLAIDGDARRGVVCVVRADGRFGEVDVATGAWSWGITLPVDTLRELGDDGLVNLHVHRDGDAVVVRDARTLAFDARTGAERPGHVGAERAAWLGGTRWLVESALVDTADGSRKELESGAAATLDGVHFAVPEGKTDSARRWCVFGADLDKPVRAVELPLACADLAMLPGGLMVATSGRKLVVVDGTSAAELLGHADTIAGRCAAEGYLVTWDRHGTVRRWSVEKLRG